MKLTAGRIRILRDTGSITLDEIERPSRIRIAPEGTTPKVIAWLGSPVTRLSPPGSSLCLSRPKRSGEYSTAPDPAVSRLCFRAAMAWNHNEATTSPNAGQIHQVGRYRSCPRWRTGHSHQPYRYSP